MNKKTPRSVSKLINSKKHKKCLSEQILRTPKKEKEIKVSLLLLSVLDRQNICFNSFFAAPYREFRIIIRWVLSKPHNVNKNLA